MQYDEAIIHLSSVTEELGAAQKQGVDAAGLTAILQRHEEAFRVLGQPEVFETLKSFAAQSTDGFASIDQSVVIDRINDILEARDQQLGAALDEMQTDTLEVAGLVARHAGELPEGTAARMVNTLSSLPQLVFYTNDAVQFAFLMSQAMRADIFDMDSAMQRLDRFSHEAASSLNPAFASYMPASVAAPEPASRPEAGFRPPSRRG